MIRALSAATLLALAAPAPAAAEFADTIPVTLAGPAVSVALKQRVARVARRVWAQSPCNGKTRAVYNGDFSSWTNRAGSTVFGASWRTECTIAVAPIDDPLLWCTTVVHERGHLAGFGHHDRTVGGGIMRRSPLPRYGPCVAAVGLGITRADAARHVRRDVLGVDPHVAGLVVRCWSSVDAGTKNCRAAWRGGAERYRVQRNEDGVTVS